MKIVELAQHIHELRAARSGRSIGSAMNVSEVWNAATDCPKNGISKLFYYETALPRPFDGTFFRLREESGRNDIGLVYAHKDLDKHWREFVAIKEVMHCWSPGHTYVGTPEDAKQLVVAQCNRKERYTPSLAADNIAILAAAEVILPHFTVEWHFKKGHDHHQIAASHGLHPDVAEMICRFDLLQIRKKHEL